MLETPTRSRHRRAPPGQTAPRLTSRTSRPDIASPLVLRDVRGRSVTPVSRSARQTRSPSRFRSELIIDGYGGERRHLLQALPSRPDFRWPSPRDLRCPAADPPIRHPLWTDVALPLQNAQHRAAQAIHPTLDALADGLADWKPGASTLAGMQPGCHVRRTRRTLPGAIARRVGDGGQARSRRTRVSMSNDVDPVRRPSASLSPVPRATATARSTTDAAPSRRCPRSSGRQLPSSHPIRRTSPCRDPTARS